MTYLLYRLEAFGAAPTTAPLGRYSDFDSALTARDHDVTALLVEHPSPPRELNHLIVGPGLRGPRTEHQAVTYAGVNVTDPDPSVEIAATAAWLDVVRGR